MDLHYSQTTHAPCPARSGFTTLWIYTILKRRPCGQRPGVVSLPYGFTLFSNIFDRLKLTLSVSLPYGFTLFSNSVKSVTRKTGFHYLMDLHYSQTRYGISNGFFCFTTLWIYTILKPMVSVSKPGNRFTTLWIYTILKHLSVCRVGFISFTTLWIYTILKRNRILPQVYDVSLPYGFTLFSNIDSNCIR